ncbi:Calcium uniporter protein [Heracleum sosnowskyi]|uniref:Calcium uniporter protein n=1 Tax=Heracleum sosnowskyi TaxID=360622 RepID=A0AAD8J256_9APIA|nr:Calcium uniporter protein [Heracleum sosnowskyi]
MSFRRILWRRFFFTKKRDLPALTVQKSNTIQHGLLATPPDPVTENCFITRFLTRKSINQYYSARKPTPEFLFTPVGDKLREKLWPLNKLSEDKFRYDINIDIAPQGENLEKVSLSVTDVKRMWKSWQMEKLRSKLREMAVSSIAYSDFLKICIEVCQNEERGLECAKMLDDAGNVIVTGKVVFLRPDQIARSMEKLLFESIAGPDDPRKEELDKLEKEKVVIDVKAKSLVRRELYCGLGFLLLQTMGFMRLTFWELSWDIMEPICFFVTSLHFALAYGFFIRTFKEPTFENYFRRRFLVKQAKLIKVHNFDIEKYQQLRNVFDSDYKASEKI